MIWRQNAPYCGSGVSFQLIPVQFVSLFPVDDDEALPISCWRTDKNHLQEICLSCFFCLLLIYFFIVFIFPLQINQQYILRKVNRISYPLPYARTTRLYKASILQTNATNGFRVVFRDLLLNSAEVQIGTGNDPSDIQSGITTIHGLITYEPDDVYVETNEMWFTAIGPKDHHSLLRMDVEIISIDLSSKCWINFLLNYL